MKYISLLICLLVVASSEASMRHSSVELVITPESMANISIGDTYAQVRGAGWKFKEVTRATEDGELLAIDIYKSDRILLTAIFNEDKKVYLISTASPLLKLGAIAVGSNLEELSNTDGIISYIGPGEGDLTAVLESGIKLTLNNHGLDYTDNANYSQITIESIWIRD